MFSSTVCFCHFNEFQPRISRANKIKTFFRIDENSTLKKHLTGRHEPLICVPNNNYLEEFSEEIKILFSNQESEFMTKLNQVKFDVLSCCEVILEKHNKDPFLICLKTKNFKSEWRKERETRITGSRCFELFTYFKNKKPDWTKKAEKYFFAKSVSTKQMKHGIKSESLACAAYEANEGVKIVQCGLIVSRQSPWLGYSPDGIVFKHDHPYKLIEIKCPFNGKTMIIRDTLKTIKWIQITEENEVIFKNRQYYAQVQFGMVVLNLKLTTFIIYCSFDNSFLLFHIEFDENYCINLLKTLEDVYFEKLLHELCKIINENQANK